MTDSRVADAEKYTPAYTCAPAPQRSQRPRAGHPNTDGSTPGRHEPNERASWHRSWMLRQTIPWSARKAPSMEQELPLQAPFPQPSQAPAPPQPRPALRRWMRALTVLACVVALSVGAVFAYSELISSKARVLADANVRSGPSSSARIAGTLREGETVEVACMARSWARLESPHPGKYVWSKLLELNRSPDPCP
jgi:hypothetical protein